MAINIDLKNNISLYLENNYIPKKRKPKLDLSFIEPIKKLITEDIHNQFESNSDFSNEVNNAEIKTNKVLPNELIQEEIRLVQTFNKKINIDITKNNNPPIPDIIKKLKPDLLKELSPTFSQLLFKLIKQQNISETDCYKNANLDRRLFSKIRSNDDYRPKKSTVFAFIISLKLNIEDANKLLKSAGFSISHSIKRDTIMEYIISQKIYDIITVNEILDYFGCSILGQ